MTVLFSYYSYINSVLISNGLLFLSVNHTSMASLAWNSELNVFKSIKSVGKISNKLPSALFGANIYKTLESCL